MFETEPFLTGVGCGGGNYIDGLVESAQKAREAGYRVIIIAQQGLHSSKYYPLHPDDDRALRAKLNLP